MRGEIVHDTFFTCLLCLTFNRLPFGHTKHAALNRMMVSKGLRQTDSSDSSCCYCYSCHSRGSDIMSSRKAACTGGDHDSGKFFFLRRPT